MFEFMIPFFKSKRDVISEKQRELLKAYNWIKNNRDKEYISDEILELMYNSAKEKIEKFPEIFKKDKL